MANHPVIWRLATGSTPIHIFGGAPGGPEPWEPGPLAEPLLRSPEFWSETPEPGPEVPGLAIQYGLQPGHPLETWLDRSTYERANRLAESLGVAAGVLSAVRPWLACQLLQNAAREAYRFPAENSADAVMLHLAQQNGIPVRHEFPTIEDVFATFAALPREAEVEYLCVYLDELEAGPAPALERQRLWSIGDLSLAKADARRLSTAYPAFYEHIVVTRNRAWIPRIQELVDSGAGAFIVVGQGHLIGPDNVLELLAGAGLKPEAAAFGAA